MKMILNQAVQLVNFRSSSSSISKEEKLKALIIASDLHEDIKNYLKKYEYSLESLIEFSRELKDKKIIYSTNKRKNR